MRAALPYLRSAWLLVAAGMIVGAIVWAAGYRAGRRDQSYQDNAHESKW